jgi:putative colanic acid biosynthesis UDP-glucose lipid carrier transferase
MIGQRTRGLQSALLLCQLLLVPVLLILSGLLTFTSVSSIEASLVSHYPVYAVAAMLGLLLESMSRDRARVRMNLWQHSFVEQHRVTVRQVAYALGTLLVYLAGTKDQAISRWFLAIFSVIFYGGLLSANYWLPGILARQIFHRKWIERTVLIGKAGHAGRLRGWLRGKEAFGLHTVGILRTDGTSCQDCEGLPCLGGVANLEDVILRESITQVIVLELPQEREQHREIVRVLEKMGVRLLILSNLEELLEHPVVHIEDEGMRFITLRQEPLENPVNRFAKRALDLAVALPVVLFILPPLMLVIWIVHRFQSPGSLFFTQKRAGIQNREFKIIKFRTMHQNNPDEARQAVKGDVRVFRFGRLLRRLSLDELPQFINVLKGDMSVTGPRPHMIEHNAQFAQQMANYHIRTFVKPGITGLAQVRGFRGEARSEAEIAKRLESDISYLENWRLALDLSIIARTAWQLLVPPKTAY